VIFLALPATEVVADQQRPTGGFGGHRDFYRSVATWL
jgi:hypothetical protein